MDLRSGEQGTTGSIVLENSSREIRHLSDGIYILENIALISSANAGRSCLRRNKRISVLLISPLNLESIKANASSRLN